MPAAIASLIRRVRPAPFQVFLLNLFRLNRRRVISIEHSCFFADPTSDFGTRLLLGSYEQQLTDQIKSLLHPGQKFLDLGANEGFFTVMASRLVGFKGEVVAVEPQSRLTPIIQKNLTLNGCFNCRVVQCAVGGKDGEIALNLAPTTNTGSTSIYQVARYKLATETVRCSSLETLITQLDGGGFDLVKVDLEGAEYEVLMAAEGVLRAGKLKRIALELHPKILEKQGLDPGKLHQHLLSCGYTLEVQDPPIYAFSALS